jgi:nitroreductase
VRKNFLHNAKTNGSARYDLGAANALLSLQAAHMGLNVHQMGGFDREKARVDLHVPDTHEVMVMLAVGYAGSPDQLPEHLRLREFAPRTRYTQDAFVRNNPFE